MTVALSAVDARHRREVLLGPQPDHRERPEVARVRPVPVAEQVLGGVWGMPQGLCSSGHSPATTRSISARMEIIASQNRSSSRRLSLSVGSTISVPATGKLIVGAWNP